MEEKLFYYLAGVPLLGVLAQWISWRVRLPSILLLLGFGVILGRIVDLDELLADLAASESDFGNKLLLPIVSLSVAVVLFEGGLSLRLSELRTVGNSVIRLVTVGALVSWLLIGGAAWLILDLDPRVALLIGAVLVVTGPTVVAPLLRHIRPQRDVESIVKWEGIVIDPIGAILAVLVFEQVFGGHHSHDSTWLDGLILLVKTAAIGVLLGGGVALILVQLIRRYWLPDYLHSVTVLTFALASFAVSNWLQSESGLVTITLLGVILANQKSIPINHVIEFKENLGILLISCLFIVLGSRLNPMDLVDLGGGGFFFLLALIFVIRPISVFISTFKTSLPFKHRLFLAFLAPRGIVAAAVSSVFALEVLSLASGNQWSRELVGDAEKLVPITFLVIVGTVSFYGVTAGPLARLLNLSVDDPQGVLFAGSDPLGRMLAHAVQDAGFSVTLVDTNYRHIAAAKMEGLPAECVSVLAEQVYERADLAGIGRLVALTPNEEVNAMATREFAHMFGRANVFQLPPRNVGSSSRASLSEHQRGRLAFGESCHYEHLVSLVNSGWQIKTTSLSDEFSFEDFQQRYGANAVLLFVVDQQRSLQIWCPDRETAPKSGQTVIALVNADLSDPQSD